MPRCGFESHGFRLDEQHVRWAERQRQCTSIGVGSSAAEQVFVKHPRVGSSPTRPSFIAG